MKIIYRNEKKEEELIYSKSVRFLYNTVIGRFILKLLTRRFVSKIGAYFFNSRLSLFLKNKVIKGKNIDMTKFVDINYNSYNKFFTRKYRPKYLEVDNDKNVFISPCDSKLMILKINEHSSFKIKNSYYKLDEIINDDIVNDYKNGYLLIFRLDVNNYHRYCFIDDGKRSVYHYIKGIFHTVQPIAYDKEKVFSRNAREWCILNTNNFDDIIQVEVGALMVGKIVNNKDIVSFKKGDEKGYFEFGGSTILLFVKDNIVSFDEDILINSKDGNETVVEYGSRIGVRR